MTTLRAIVAVLNVIITKMRLLNSLARRLAGSHLTKVAGLLFARFKFGAELSLLYGGALAKPRGLIWVSMGGGRFLSFFLFEGGRLASWAGGAANVARDKGNSSKPTRALEEGLLRSICADWRVVLEREKNESCTRAKRQIRVTWLVLRHDQHALTSSSCWLSSSPTWERA